MGRKHTLSRHIEKKKLQSRLRTQKVKNAASSGGLGVSKPLKGLPSLIKGWSLWRKLRWFIGPQLCVLNPDPALNLLSQPTSRGLDGGRQKPGSFRLQLGGQGRSHLGNSLPVSPSHSWSLSLSVCLPGGLIPAPSPGIHLLILGYLTSYCPLDSWMREVKNAKVWGSKT